VLTATALVVGPGGVGKGPLDFLFKSSVCRIDPYRLRPTGPRDVGDILYAHPKLRDELQANLLAVGDKLQTVGEAEWFPRARTLFFKVRREWQFVLLAGIGGKLAKLELYAPVLLTVLTDQHLASCFGNTFEVIILNPASESVTTMTSWQELEAKMLHNCKQRGDSAGSIEKRVSSIGEEAPAWRDLVATKGALEYPNWPFPEYVFKNSEPGTSKVDHQKRFPLELRRYCWQENPHSKPFSRQNMKSARFPNHS
jgi:hypothetical protein